MFYTFAEYLEDNVICEEGYAIRATAEELRAVWNLYREGYISFCMRAGYDYEIIY